MRWRVRSWRSTLECTSKLSGQASGDNCRVEKHGAARITALKTAAWNHPERRAKGVGSARWERAVGRLFSTRPVCLATILRAAYRSCPAGPVARKDSSTKPVTVWLDKSAADRNRRNCPIGILRPDGAVRGERGQTRTASRTQKAHAYACTGGKRVKCVVPGYAIHG